MKMIYNNFDALDVSFQGALPHKILDQLARAKEKAQSEKREVLAHIGKNKLSVMVAETAARGYSYRFDTGFDGEIWFVANSTNSKLWNIRVSVKSLNLALNGYEAVKQGLIERLNDFEAMGLSPYPDGTTSNNKTVFLPLERISRFDYCFDFVTEKGFQPYPERFVAHQRAKKHVYGERGGIDTYHSLNGDTINTVRIGEMPGRQVVVYNKTKEIIASSKKYWWQIWGLDPKSFKESFKEIWRVEVRAGRDELDKWPLKRFKEFDDKAGDVIASILKAIRYTDPLNGDLNRSRWPMAFIWEESLNTSYKALAPYSTNAIRENAIRDHRENVIAGYKERAIGNIIGLVAAQGRDISEIPITVEELENDINAISKTDISALTKKFERAEERFRFLK